MRHPSRTGLEGLPVLLVEDDPMSAVASVLTGAGCNVRVAVTAEAALAALQGFVPGAIVLDLVLPRMSGLLLAARLKSLAATRHLPIIALSAIDAPSATSLALDTGCAPLVRKPIDPLNFPATLAFHVARPGLERRV